jgi:hypothetical protein
VRKRFRTRHHGGRAGLRGSLCRDARDRRRLENLVEKHTNRVRTAPHDVADEQAAKAAVHVAVDTVVRVCDGGPTIDDLPAPTFFEGWDGTPNCPDLCYAKSMNEGPSRYPPGVGNEHASKEVVHRVEHLEIGG